MKNKGLKIKSINNDSDNVEEEITISWSFSQFIQNIIDILIVLIFLKVFGYL